MDSRARALALDHNLAMAIGLRRRDVLCERRVASVQVRQAAAAGSVWVYERHGDVVYSYGRNGAHTLEARYRNTLYGELSAGRRWIEERSEE